MRTAVFAPLCLPAVFFFTVSVLPAAELPALTPERQLVDWIFQDYGFDAGKCFTDSTGNAVETAMLQKVLTTLKAGGFDTAKYEGQIAELKNAAGSDPQWKNLYIRLCKERRKLRLADLAKTSPKIIYTRHCVLSGPCQMHPTDMVSDHPYEKWERHADFRPGARLCLMTVQPDGTMQNETLLETQTGLIRDPNLSFDGTKILFSMRNNFTDDDYHLYIMDLSDGNKVTQITNEKAVSDVEPAFLPDGNIVFQSTRCVQVTDCWPVPVSNLYVCNADGSRVRRVGYDQVHTLYPQVLDNGNVIYTRWEYNDRNPVHQQPLFQMNPDGTAQAVFYGGGEYYPTSIIHARGIPGSNKVIAVASGHHTDQRGKLIMIDQSKGMDENAGITFLAPVRKSEVPHMTKTIFNVNDQFGQSGEQFQYPYALDENNYIVTYIPEGRPRARYRSLPFGIYWMNAGGDRELLAFDPAVSCGQPVVLKPRPVPPVKPSQVDLAQETGKYYIQDVYTGRAMNGVKRGTVKSMRIVGLEFRAAPIRDGQTQGILNKTYGARESTDRVTTPIAAGSGSWDVKHVLGEVPVEEDGSVFIEVPARTPVFFQLLDEKGHCIQSMRSWTTLQPGETFACVGCHEDKMTSPAVSSSATLAMQKPVRTLPKRTAVHPVDTILTVNTPKGFDRTEGFSYTREIQPVWDKHCVSCHNGETNQAAQKALPDLRGTVHADLENDYQEHREHPWKSNGRAYLTSYLQLTNYGVSGKWIRWIDAESEPMVQPPYANGSAQSELMKFLEPSHYNVAVSPEEKRRVACWIDLCVPFCGSYAEANVWTDEQKKLHQYFEDKRKKFAEGELELLKK
ncbi:MAG: hypothetical protein LBH00_00195 [Planctomycetaceae bacterium]|jgi:cytochrome c553|nr:hypothetical protein [Planctomycetaceae bacterium]